MSCPVRGRVPQVMVLSLQNSPAAFRSCRIDVCPGRSRRWWQRRSLRHGQCAPPDAHIPQHPEAHIIIQHQTDIINMDPPANDIRSHQYFQLFVLKIQQYLLPAAAVPDRFVSARSESPPCAMFDASLSHPACFRKKSICSPGCGSWGS